MWWSGIGYIPDWVRNIVLLLDVPMFFFLAGWSSSYTKAIHTFKGLIENQKKWLFFMFLYGLVVELFNKPGYSISQWIRIFFYKFPEYSLWVYPILFGSLWFMPVFIGVSLIVIPFRFIDEFLDEANRKKLGFSIVWIFILAFLYVEQGNNILNVSLYVLFYAIFYTLGYYSKNASIKKFRTLLLYFVIIFLSELLLYQYLSLGVFDLQSWKFDPRTPYLIPSFLSILIVLYIKTRWKPSTLPLLTWVVRNALFVYFAQGISSSILYEFLMFIPLIFWPIRFMIALAFNLTLALGLAWVVSFLYSKSSKLLSRHNQLLFLSDTNER